MKKIIYTLGVILPLIASVPAMALDTDGDSVSDEADNCWDVSNATQTDLDGDNVGDSCDIDRDGDGYANDFETSVLQTSPDLWDTDNDGVSDLYDCGKTDPELGYGGDCDIVYVMKDTPPPPPEQDIIDPDADDDEDGILNSLDNCPTVFNPAQQDGDEDGNGDACDNMASIVHPVAYAQGGSCSLTGAASVSGGAAASWILLVLVPGVLATLKRS